jgi:3-carboxy-cis,cis-muconate cycloisomerase
MGLFDGVLARGHIRQAVDDRAWLQAMLDVEAGLARAQARAGLLPADHAEAIARACRADAFDLAALGRDAASGGNPVIPLVRALGDAVPGPAGAAVHTGATSQDILDSAAMLVAHRALGPLLDDLAGAATAAADLAAAHRATALAGRTLLQQALPVTFGFKAAGWLVALDEAAARLGEVRRTRLAVQLGGAVGTLASLGDAGTEVLTGLARELGLAEPVLPWHTARTRVAELAGALGTAAGVAGKVTRDVVLLAQTEVAEAAEVSGTRGGSSAMPHKNNPVAAISARACARRAPGLVATLFAAMEQEHERAAGAWHSEWPTLTELLTTVGSAASWLAESLAGLRIDPARMADTVAGGGHGELARAIAEALTPSLGAGAAHDAAADAVQQARETGRPLADILAGRPEVDLTALPTAPDVGEAAAQVDAVLADHRRLTEGTE